MNEWPPSTKPFRASPPEGAVAIALPIRDNLRFFKLCYHSILGFTDYRHMLTIVDNMSGWETRQYLESIRRNHNINVLQFQKEHNLAAEWNLAIRFMFAFASVKYGVVMKPTVVFEPFWLSGMVKSIALERVAAAVPTTNGEPADVLLFNRQAYEELDGFREDIPNPLQDFTERVTRRQDGVVVQSHTLVHQFQINGFDPKREEPIAAAPQETTEAKA